MIDIFTQEKYSAFSFRKSIHFKGEQHDADFNEAKWRSAEYWR